MKTPRDIYITISDQNLRTSGSPKLIEKNDSVAAVMADNINNPVVITIYPDITGIKQETMETEDIKCSQTADANSQSDNRTSFEVLLRSPKREVIDNDEDYIDVSVLHEEVDLGISVIDSEEDIKLSGLVDSLPMDNITGACDTGSRPNLAGNNSSSCNASLLLEVGHRLSKRTTTHNNSGEMGTNMTLPKRRKYISIKEENQKNPRQLVTKSNDRDYKFCEKIDLQRHLRTHAGVNPFACDVCDYRCSDRSTLQRHSRTHTGEKPYVCSYCHFTCSLRSNLQRHSRTHTGDKPFVCDVCDYRCSDRRRLQVHSRTHTGEKPYSCNECDYACSRNFTLQIHLRTHTGEKPFACDICDYRCSDRSGLQRHSRIHTGEKPYSCNYCDFKFSDTSGLQKHLRTHTGEKPYACNDCDKKFTRKYILQRHLNSHC